MTEEEIRNEMRYSYGYINPDVLLGNSNSRRRNILVYDYNGYHIGLKNNYEKYYNYFPSAFKTGPEKSPVKVNYTCLDVACDYLLDQSVINNNFFAVDGFFTRTA